MSVMSLVVGDKPERGTKTAPWFNLAELFQLRVLSNWDNSVDLEIIHIFLINI
jgi:hypothetical protein